MVAYEYIIRNQDDEVRLYKSDPRNTFVIYDNTIEQNSLIAVRYWQTAIREQEDTVIMWMLLHLTQLTSLLRINTNEVRRT